ncbi:hypothetical protein [Aureispira anguillae]|uniref:Uncharacterized protein n=1 Tax=Aureispira anguillae TaxID=2864201 RepID=A0A915YLI4_9BACT|nr:hypothetical protein [Aureispira anguillae]BDS15127.1 hypothetical protein AsAng_0059110 [Aureispira anguillae]
MQRFYFIGFLLFLTLHSSQAQTTSSTIFYAKDSSSIIKLNSYLKTVFVFSPPPNYQTPTELPITLSLKDAAITIPTLVEQSGDERAIVFGEFPSIVFNTKLKGHISFGKAMLTALDSAGTDSVITIATQTITDTNISGPLYLDFKNWNSLADEYWTEVEYYWLLGKQMTIQDSITKLTADNNRAAALLKASTKYLTATADQIELGEKELNKKYSQYSTTIESLKKINARIDETFEKSKAGKQLTPEEKKQIAYLTADGSKIKKELKQQPDGKSTLAVFERMSRAITQHKSAQKQYHDADTLLQKKTERLNLTVAEFERIQKRLSLLKRILKL